MAHDRTKLGKGLVSAWAIALAGYRWLGNLFLGDAGGCKEVRSSQASGRDGPNPMKIVTAVLQIEYVDREMPDLIQTMIWQTYDESPEFPRLVDQLNEISGQEGREIKNWFISQKDPLGPKQTHGLQSVRAN